MIERGLRWLHGWLSPPWYSRAVVLVATWASVVVTVVTTLVVSLYFSVSTHQILVVLVVGVLSTTCGVVGAAFGTRAGRRELDGWRTTPEPTDAETASAWELAITLFLSNYRRASLLVIVAAVTPIAVAVKLVWAVSWTELAAILFAALVPSIYGTFLSYSVSELMMRPVIAEVAARLPDDFDFRAFGVPIATRLALLLPTYTTMAGLTVAGLTGHGGGAARLATVAGISLAVGLFFAAELTSLLGESISRPIADVRRQLTRVREQDFSARSPVLSGDELGELAYDFNLMASGLAERERMRATFGTYVDRDVARLILDESASTDGVEVEVSVLFVDVRGFTTYAESVGAREVVTSLNALFAEVVRAVEAEGGHVDKFLGDGVMAFFGAPDPQVDHADRALAAACRIVAATSAGDGTLRVGVGVSSGQVVAGPLGGSGRLNFSIIGDAVNVAARVEAATRETGDDILITGATRALLRRPPELVSRGAIPLKGKQEPVEVWTPAPPG